ncbi:recombinase family protein [Kitasatospora sp. NPDC056181]|uniref:recombinase family protein n=1 Tax=Kitasatospora sp. NPDC056181 TaxID=3345737 RepID=UPI0035DFC947
MSRPSPLALFVIVTFALCHQGIADIAWLQPDQSGDLATSGVSQCDLFPGTMPAMTRRAAIYCRISQDREGAGLGIARQEADCRALCERRGWQVVGVYPDNDTSAYSGKPREKWLALLEDVRAGLVDAVVCWHVDRLTRSPRELEDVIDLADKHGVELGTVTGEIDLGTPTGRLIARMLGAAARHEAEHKAERQARQRRQAAEAGKLSGGGGRPFGYDDDSVTVRESEAAIVREAARRTLALESLSSICKDFHQRGFVTPAGRPFTPTSLRRMLASARISGRREYRPRKVGETTRPLLGEIVADAVWPGIISDTDSDRLRTLLSEPGRRKTGPTSGGRVYINSGILHCAKPRPDGKPCGWGMVGRPRSGVPRYVCPNVPGTDSCGGTATNAKRTDDHVRDMVLAALASEQFMERLSGVEPAADAELLAEIKADEQELEDLATDFGSRKISRAEWMAARTVFDGRLEFNRARLARITRHSVLRTFVGSYDDMHARWKDKLNDSQRRAVVGAAVHRIDVLPSDPRRKWDPDRFVFDWVA